MALLAHILDLFLVLAFANICMIFVVGLWRLLRWGWRPPAGERAARFVRALAAAATAWL
ncbi:hypothetical protein SNOG_05279 [Parastagonospora nodorum SN15]|uniref:Uncharacterized protein n=2 Tax=Phaeosphaeria nodorum (strain SN15 / ATCC MYA-4574 / FGSC 10173) TaxID=321614 RepID=A0A7U2FGA0_PHANO|nr:hypothetical protein SNOG_05279 [Parastagonospora nodorum SN15]EAT87670.1 hypothetical protein SNOG_05279 [Parastagonospora nodorum SN15]QRD02306.1 hypothetical protein JI435_052790 [Parastagonospora nodorum SN15]